MSEAVDYKYVGTRPIRPDGVEKVTGRAKYAGDIRLPGMRYAKILRPPAHGATLSQLDTSGVEKIPGVEIVRDEELVYKTTIDKPSRSIRLNPVPVSIEHATSNPYPTTSPQHTNWWGICIWGLA